jgi:hypothetical protein
MEGDETMSREDIVAIGSRLLAVYLAITVLQTVMVLVPAFFTEDGVPLLWRVGIAASVLAMLGMSALLVRVEDVVLRLHGFTWHACPQSEGLGSAVNLSDAQLRS